MGRMLRELIGIQEHDAKAFPYNVSLTDAGGPLYFGGAPAAYNVYAQDGSMGAMSSGRILTPLSQRNARQHIQTYGGGEAIDWLMDAVNFTVTAASSADYHFAENGKPLVRERDPMDPVDTPLAPPMLVALFDSPNPYMDWTDLCEITLIDWLLVGNAYWVKWKMNQQGQPLALYRMAPQYVRIIPGEFGPARYLYRLPGQRDEVEFTPDQVVHFKRTNPLDPYYGMGIVQGGARALDMEIALTKTMASYYEKQALPSGVVQTERRVPRDVFNKLKAQLRSFYGGGDNAGQLMVLEAGLNYKSVSPSAADARFQELGSWSRDRILAMFNLNKGLLGLQDVPGDPKLGDWQLLFDRKTMIPITNKFSKAISRALVKPAWGLDFVIDYEETQQPDEIIKRAGLLAGLPGVKIKEVRAAANLPPSTGDPELDELVLNASGPNMDTTGQGGTADRNLPGEPGRPPIVDNVPTYGTRMPPPAHPSKNAISPRAKKSVDSMVEELTLRALELETKALPPADHVHIGELSGDHVTPPQDVLHSKRTTEIDVLRDDTARQLDQAAHTLERGLLDAAEGKASGTVYQRIKNAKAWQAFRERVASVLEDAAKGALSLANVHHAGTGLDPAEIDYDATARTIAYRPKGGVADILNTLRDRILGGVLRAQRAGSDQAAVEAAIRDGITAWATRGIAQDIAHRAYNEATVAITESNGGTHVLVSDGEDFDAPCRAANGQTWPITQARDNLLEHPNCRRGFVPVI